MDRTQVEGIVRAMLEGGVPLDWRVYVLLVLVSAVSAFAAAYIGGYAKRRAENLATKADFDEILRQLKRTTDEAERIKNAIQASSWVDQRKWELKRDIYVGLVEALEDIRVKTGFLGEKLLSAQQRSASDFRLIESYMSEIEDKDRIGEMIRNFGLAKMLLSDAAVFALKELEELYLDIVVQALRDDLDPYALLRLSEDTERALELILDASQRDLVIRYEG